MSRHAPLTPEKEEEILAALARDAHASRVARTLGDVSYATVWRVAERNDIDLKAGREAKGYKRFPPEVWVKVEHEVAAAQPGATQEELAHKIGVSRSTVGRAVRARRAPPAPAG
jgi:Helix-turn-helix